MQITVEKKMYKGHPSFSVLIDGEKTKKDLLFEQKLAGHTMVEGNASLLLFYEIGTIFWGSRIVNADIPDFSNDDSPAERAGKIVTRIENIRNAIEKLRLQDEAESGTATVELIPSKEQLMEKIKLLESSQTPKRDAKGRFTK